MAVLVGLAGELHPFGSYEGMHLNNGMATDFVGEGGKGGGGAWNAVHPQCRKSNKCLFLPGFSWPGLGFDQI